MRDLENDADPAALRALQIIVLALAGGVVIFGVIAALAPPASGQTPVDLSVLRVVSLVLVVSAVPLALVMRHAILRRGLPERRPGAPPAGPPPELDELVRRFQTATIVSAALLEGAGLFAVVVFLIGRDPIDLVLAAVPVGLLLGAIFPTSGRWRRLVRFARDGSLR